MTGQITVTTAGTRVQGSNSLCTSLILKAHPSNTGIVYVGNSSVSSSTGFPLSAGDAVLVDAGNLNELYFDASANAQKICYLQLRER